MSSLLVSHLAPGELCKLPSPVQRTRAVTRQRAVWLPCSPTTKVYQLKLYHGQVHRQITGSTPDRDVVKNTPWIYTCCKVHRN